MGSAWSTIAVPVALLSVALLAGCMGSDEEAPVLPSLVDMKECDLRWQDGSDAPCETNLPALDARPGVPDLPWACLRSWSFNDFGIRIYHEPLEDRYAVWTDLTSATGAPLGWIHDGQTPLEVWRPVAEGTSYVVVPDGHATLTDAGFQVALSTVDVDEPASLDDAMVHVDLVAEGGSAAPVFHLEGVAGDRYHFSPLGPASEGYFDFTFFGIGEGTYFFAGEDFELTFSMEHSGDLQFGAPVNPTCNTG